MAFHIFIATVSLTQRHLQFRIGGSGLKKALDYLLPIALGNETWPYTQIKPIDKDGLHDLICQAIVNYGDNDSYIKAYRSLDQMNNTMQVDGLIYGCASLMLIN